MARNGKGSQPTYKPPLDDELFETGAKLLLYLCLGGVAFITWFSAQYIIDPGQTGFEIELKRLGFVVALTAANMGTWSLLRGKAARFAAEGSQAARAVIVLCVITLVPLNTSVGYLGLAAREVPKLEAQETCVEIRLQTSNFDQVAVAQGQIVRALEAQTFETGVRQKQERKGGRDTKKVSMENRPEPVATLWGDAQRAADGVREKFAQSDQDRASKTKQLAEIADQCERAVRDPKRWAKGGAAAVIALHDRATAVTRELAATLPMGLAQGLAETYRSIGKGLSIDGVADVRRALSDYAARIDKELAAIPRMPDPMSPLPASSIISAAFEAPRLKALWPLLMMAFTIELGGPLAVLLSYLGHRRRYEDRNRDDDDVSSGGAS